MPLPSAKSISPSGRGGGGGGGVFGSEKSSSIIGGGHSSSAQKYELRKAKTFFSQMDKDKNVGYLQYEEDMVKVQVRWGTEIFVLKFLLF